MSKTKATGHSEWPGCGRRDGSPRQQCQAIVRFTSTGNSCGIRDLKVDVAFNSTVDLGAVCSRSATVVPAQLATKGGAVCAASYLHGCKRAQLTVCMPQRIAEKRGLHYWQHTHARARAPTVMPANLLRLEEERQTFGEVQTYDVHLQLLAALLNYPDPEPPPPHPDTHTHV